VVVSGEQNEVDKFEKFGLDISIHRKKMAERNLEKEFKDPDNPFRLAIVCAMWITGFDAQCVSTVYLDKPIKGHTLMQTIARANRVYDDEKENGLIVDYGNVYKQLEKAYSVYGEGGKSGGSNEKPIEELEELATELEKAIAETETYLESLNFNLIELIEAKPMEKIGRIQMAADAVSLNESTRAAFELMARNVFRKYKALFPEQAVKQFTRRFTAIEAIYSQLNQQVKDADVSDIILRLQSLVSKSVNLTVLKEPEQEIYVDLGGLDFDKLKAAFNKLPNKNTTLFNLQKALDKKMAQMMRENPLRLDFYERYQKIIEDYNKGKSLEDTVTAFGKLTDFIQELDTEDKRAIREQLDQESLAIFDLLCEGKELSEMERKSVKKIASELLNKLKAEQLKVEKWRESRQITAKVKTLIFENLLELPMEVYSDEDVSHKTMGVYQHLLSSYWGAGQSVYASVG
jgi:type I restriction enzyme R subunit